MHATGNRWDQHTDYEPQSNLRTITIRFRGILLQPDRSIRSGLLTMSSFGMMSWFVLGMAFFFSGVISFMQVVGMRNVPQWLLRIAVLLFECAAPSTLLVSTVVKYVLWPMALDQGSANTEAFRNPVTLLEHNGNVIMAFVEISLLGGLPVRLVDLGIAPLFGICYVCFSWWMMDKWAPTDKGPQFLYPFFDTTLGWIATLSLLVLLAVLILFYLVFAFADHGISLLAGGIWAHVAATGAIVMLVCRWRD